MWRSPGSPGCTPFQGRHPSVIVGYDLPREDDIAGNSVLEEFAVFLHLPQAILDIREVIVIVIGGAEEETVLRGEEGMCQRMVFQHPLASVDEVIHIVHIGEGVVLFVHLASVLVVLEEEVHLAEVRIVLLVSTLDLFIQLRFQVRQVENRIGVRMNLEVVVLGDERTEFLHESEVPLVVGLSPIVVGLQLLPRLFKGLEKFVNLRPERGLGEFVHLVGELAEILRIGFITLKGYLCAVKINIESDSYLLFNVKLLFLVCITKITILS